MTLLRNNKTLWVTMVMAALTLSGCGGPRLYPAEQWTLPAKTAPETAMFIGRIGLPDGKLLTLRDVTLQRWGKVYFHAGTVPRGEKNFVMQNNYFVVPNVQPGKYWFAGFYAAGAYNGLPAKKSEFIDIKAGEVKYVGSWDYYDGKLSTLRMSLGIPGSYGLKPAAKPSELEMLQWLARVDNGSGWEPAIRQRTKELGGKP